jgi:hypothetical protein
MAWKYPDVVVVLPGLIGSALTKDGRPLWGITPGSLWGIVAGKALKELSLASVDNEEDDLGDGIVATSLIDNVEIVLFVTFAE